MKTNNLAGMLRRRLPVIFLYFALAVLSCILIQKKADYFWDELYTYTLANTDGWIHPETGVVYTPASAPFYDDMTSSGKIDMGIVWKNQADDVHPPLYYIFVHLICAMFPHTFSNMYAGIVNIVFVLMTLFVYRRILELLIKDDAAVFILSVMFVLTAGILSMATFLRMYVMLFFFVTALAYVIIRHIDRFTLRDYVYLCILTLCGALTHYYYIVFAFFISATTVIIMLMAKRWKETALYSISFFVGLALAYLIFPAMRAHIMESGRGTESFENLAQSDLAERLKVLYKVLNNNMFGGWLTIILTVIAFILMTSFLNKDEGEDPIINMEPLLRRRYICILIPSLCFFILIVKTSPYLVERYISPVFPLLLAGLMSLFYKCITSILSKKVNCLSVFAVLVGLILITGYSNISDDSDDPLPYLYRDHADIVTYSSEFGKDANAVCVYTRPCKIYPYFQRIRDFKTVMFVEASSYDEFSQLAGSNDFGDKVAFFLTDENEDFAYRFAEDHPEYTQVNDLYSCIYLVRN
ncbi:MAG: glycosyltransferase family 39 protein [Lachnospiraceae bacterium]|nr:glycosyltransferase family 39 protein [Lachnospiraceae bacterium]